MSLTEEIIQESGIASDGSGWTADVQYLQASCPVCGWRTVDFGSVGGCSAMVILAEMYAHRARVHGQTWLLQSFVAAARWLLDYDDPGNTRGSESAGACGCVEILGVYDQRQAELAAELLAAQQPNGE